MAALVASTPNPEQVGSGHVADARCATSARQHNASSNLEAIDARALVIGNLIKWPPRREMGHELLESNKAATCLEVSSHPLFTHNRMPHVQGKRSKRG